MDLSLCPQVDTFRAFYPNVSENPGYSWPSYAQDCGVSPLSGIPYAKKISEKDRIDFVFADTKIGWRVTDAKVIGGNLFIDTHFAKDVQPGGEGQRYVPVSPGLGGKEYEVVHDNAHLLRWPSDHKGMLITFDIGQEKK